MSALADALRRAGCVFAEAEAAEVARHLGSDASRVAEVVAGRAAGIPLEHLLGVARFAGHDVELDPLVFVPRRRAEALVELTVAHLRERPPGIVVDVGCGSGAIAAALRHALPDWRVEATEIDPAALSCARRNGETHGFGVHEGSWLAGLPSELAGRVDAVVGYLPHVPDTALESIHPDLRRHEPDLAVAGGADGLDGFREVLDQLPAWWSHAGALLTLLAPEQVPAARQHLDRRTQDSAPTLDLHVTMVDDDAIVRVDRSGTIDS